MELGQDPFDRGRNPLAGSWCLTRPPRQSAHKAERSHLPRRAMSRTEAPTADEGQWCLRPATRALRSHSCPASRPAPGVSRLPKSPSALPPKADTGFSPCHLSVGGISGSVVLGRFRGIGSLAEPPSPALSSPAPTG